ncbi:hypothetical protein VaNZ11_002473 [Volvox africanus]|uniref:Reverse transcriptase domain-containing protein n=1 Tax=Volvox africanus TaxID=51714 RepID=A0ABQ5RTC4_9CHLO|nr:hypothetical protein VaNZ11_002473 [Volvox africanus]
MASLFTAICATGQLPAGFLERRISVLYKVTPNSPATTAPSRCCVPTTASSPRCLQTAWHPPWAKSLALNNRCSSIPKCPIAASVLFQRHLFHLLCKQNCKAHLVCLDFAKAYNTVDHGFLLGALEVMGAGPQLRS